MGWSVVSREIVAKYVEDKIKPMFNYELEVKGNDSGDEDSFDITVYLIKMDTYSGTKEDYIARFTLKEMINCCGILVSTDTWVDPKYQGKGIAQKLMPIKEAIAKECGYTLFLSTVAISDNPKEVHILEKFGWHLDKSFVNKRTKNTVGIFTKEIN